MNEADAAILDYADHRPHHSARRWTQYAPLILICTIAAYLPALRADFIWDDDKYVTDNLTLRDADGLRRIWLDSRANSQYYPMVFTTFWVEHALWQNTAAGYHFTNILLHACNAILLLGLLDLLGVPGALWAALIFALHPVHVESVAWITERKNVLSGFFYLLATSAYLRFDPMSESRQRKWGFYAAALILFACALFSKTVACSLPAAILLIIWWKKGRLAKTDVVPVIPMFAIGATLAGVTVWLEKVHVGAEGQDWHFSWVERCLVAGRAVWFYLGKLVWPSPLIFIYERWNVHQAEAWQYLFPMSAIAGLAALWRFRDRLGRGPLVAALFFVGTLTPALGFVDVYPFRFSFVADHFQYLASLGPIVLAGCLIAKISQSGQQRRVMTGLLLVLGVLTFRQCLIYKDRESLWSDTRDRNPSAWIAHNNLGWVREQQGRFEEARRLYAQAVTIKPDCFEVNNNLGNMLVRIDRTAEAIPYYEAALAAMPKNERILYNLGIALDKLGRTSDSIDSYRRAIALRLANEKKDDYAEAHFNLAGELIKAKEPLAAIEEYQLTLKIRPTLVAGHLLLGELLLDLHRPAEAIEQLREVLRLKPDNAEARTKLNEALEQQRRGTIPASRPVSG